MSISDDEDDNMFVVGKKCLERVQKIFDEADKNSDGTINMDEAMRLLKVDPRVHGQILNVTDAKSKKELDEMDFNRIGILALALEAFKKYDKDKNFKLDEIEFFLALEGIGIPHGEVSQIFDSADKNEDDLLSQTEFIDVFLRLLMNA